MNSLKRIVLIGNYPPDQQESMLRFAKILSSGLDELNWDNQIWMPIVFLGKYFKTTDKGLGKWFGYIDKYILFPIILKIRMNRNKKETHYTWFHICDHSNSMYLKYFPSENAGITCHDVVAIRGSLDYPNSVSKASFLGKFLQKWILSNLKKAKNIVTVSHFTMMQLNELLTDDKFYPINKTVIYNAVNADFRCIDTIEARKIMFQAELNFPEGFLLHVGSSQPRKNRKLLIDLAVALGDSWRGKICFVNYTIDKTLKDYAISQGLEERIVQITNVPHLLLNALYCACEAFIFPSFEEGFGWPVVEAQACGVPVIASSNEPMPEISGGAALHENPFDATAFAKAFLSLKNTNLREKVIYDGLQNALRFNQNEMIRSYLDFFQSQITHSENGLHNFPNENSLHYSKL